VARPAAHASHPSASHRGPASGTRNVNRAELADNAEFDEIEADSEGEGVSNSRSLSWRALASRPRDLIAFVFAAAGIAVVLVNGLYLQPSPHPAPMFTIKPRPVGTAHSTGTVRLSRPPVDRPNGSTNRSRSEIIADIQRELERRAFYDGPIDGFDGPRTDAAIRDFEKAAGLKPALEPNEELLQTISRSPLRSVAASSPTVPARDAIGALIATSSKRVLGVQRALADFGYGPVKPTGAFGPDTRAAIEKFERDRKLPVTGEVSDRLVRELTAVTGRPLE
jgi:peptidoglycan hydrolase-like protein with peptidoglycan-binding domain